MNQTLEEALTRLVNVLTNAVLEEFPKTKTSTTSSSTSDSSDSTPAPKKKRKRRTKAEIEAARKAEDAELKDKSDDSDSDSDSDPDPDIDEGETSVEQLRKIVLEWRTKANANIKQIGEMIKQVSPKAKGVADLSPEERTQVFRIFEEEIDAIDNPEEEEEFEV